MRSFADRHVGEPCTLAWIGGTDAQCAAAERVAIALPGWHVHVLCPRMTPADDFFEYPIGWNRQDVGTALLGTNLTACRHRLGECTCLADGPTLYFSSDSLPYLSVADLRARKAGSEMYARVCMFPTRGTGTRNVGGVVHDWSRSTRDGADVITMTRRDTGVVSDFPDLSGAVRRLQLTLGTDAWSLRVLEATDESVFVQVANVPRECLTTSLSADQLRQVDQVVARVNPAREVDVSHAIIRIGTITGWAYPANAEVYRARAVVVHAHAPPQVPCYQEVREDFVVAAIAAAGSTALMFSFFWSRPIAVTWWLFRAIMMAIMAAPCALLAWFIFRTYPREAISGSLRLARGWCFDHLDPAAWWAWIRRAPMRLGLEFTAAG